MREVIAQQPSSTSLAEVSVPAATEPKTKATRMRSPLREYWALAIRLEVNLTAPDGPGEYAGSRKEFHVSLHSA